MEQNNIQVEIIKVQNASIINYCYIIHHLITKTAYLIDPAWNFSVINEIIKQKMLRLKGILITHHHFDHTNLAIRFANYYNIDIYISNVEANFYGLNKTEFKTFNACTTFELDDYDIKTYLSAGHTKGGVCYHIEKHFFCGDVLFIEGCGYCEGNGSSAEELYYSLNNIADLLTVDTLIYPGHCYKATIPQTFAYVLQNNVYLQIKDIKKFVQFRMSRNVKANPFR